MKTNNRKKSSTLQTRKKKTSTLTSSSTYNNNSYNLQTQNEINSLNTQTTDSISFININSNFKTRTKKKKYKTFLSKIKTLRHMKRILKKEDDRLIEYIDDNRFFLKKGKILKENILDKYFFNDEKKNCICENIYKKHIEAKCKCDKMKTYSSQGKSGAAIHSIICKINNTEQKQILKVMPLPTYYMKLRMETEKYLFIELDGFTIQTLINTYVYKELPNNTVNIVNSGVCNKKDYKNVSIDGNYHGYNLMEEADLGSGKDFINDILNSKYDKEFSINNEDIRYKIFTNCLLQSILIIGHLQASELEFFHGDYKPDNVFVKRCDPNKIPFFKFNVFGKTIKVKNMGFAVVIADFDRSSITLNSYFKQHRKHTHIYNNHNNHNNHDTPNKYNTNKKYRIISPILFKPLLTGYVNDIIKKYGDVDPNTFNGEIKINKLLISYFIPKKIDSTITVLRSAGVKLYRDFDLYTFFIKLIDTDKIRQYIINKKLNTNILYFMSNMFQEKLFKMPPKTLSLNESAYIVVDILQTIKEPLPIIFNNDYLNILKNLNYHLFKKD